MARDDVAITLVDRQTPVDADSVDYQPFGVKVLKLRIQRNQTKTPRPTLPPIWIRPAGYIRSDAKSNDPARWRAYATAENAPDLWVAWGAGDEVGFCVKTKDLKVRMRPAALDDDDAYTVYLNLIHRPAAPLAHAPTEKALVVQAVGEDGTVYGEKRIRLTVPAGATNPVRACWETDLDAGVSTIALRGADGGPAQIPSYVSRWWPRREVAYAPEDPTIRQVLDGLKITFTRQDGAQKQGRIDVTLDGTALAELAGDLAFPVHDCRLLSAELLRFLDDRHFVLRLWLYWVHVGFAPEHLLAFVPAARQAEFRPQAESVCHTLRNKLWARWAKTQEVPDVERFDILFDPADLTVKYVGTDTHWQEFWAVVDDGESLQACIASWKEIGKVAQQSGAVAGKDQPPVYDPVVNGLCSIVYENRVDI
ncbi:MAG: hypothetical protein JXD18_02005, partial [Anaerolineae bacterium]|nr:hypothetical protein [Anaerolineae bacterium]